MHHLTQKEAVDERDLRKCRRVTGVAKFGLDSGSGPLGYPFFPDEYAPNCTDRSAQATRQRQGLGATRACKADSLLKSGT